MMIRGKLKIRGVKMPRSERVEKLKCKGEIWKPSSTEQKTNNEIKPNRDSRVHKLSSA